MHFLVFFETPSSTHLSPLLLCCLLPYSQGFSPHSITIVLINSPPSLAAIDSTHQHHLPCSLFDHHLLFIPPCRASSSICPCCFPFLLAAAVVVLHHHHQHLHVLFLLMLTYCYSFSLQSVMVAAPLFCSTRCCCYCVNLLARTAAPCFLYSVSVIAVQPRSSSWSTETTATPPSVLFLLTLAAAPASLLYCFGL